MNRRGDHRGESGPGCLYGTPVTSADLRCTLNFLAYEQVRFKVCILKLSGEKVQGSALELGGAFCVVTFQLSFMSWFCFAYERPARGSAVSQTLHRVNAAGLQRRFSPLNPVQRGPVRGPAGGMGEQR